MVLSLGGWGWRKIFPPPPSCPGGQCTDLQAVRALSISFRSEIQSIQAVNPIAGPPVAYVSMLSAIPISAESSRLVRSAHLLESLSAACLWWPLHGVPSHSEGKRWVQMKTRAQEMALSMLLLVLYKEMKSLITSLSNKGNWDTEQSGAAYRSVDILTYIKGGGGVFWQFCLETGAEASGSCILSVLLFPLNYKTPSLFAAATCPATDWHPWSPWEVRAVRCKRKSPGRVLEETLKLKARLLGFTGMFFFSLVLTPYWPFCNHVVTLRIC